MDETIHRIIQKLAEAQRCGPKSFGSKGHGFRLNRPISEAAITAYEQKHGITLPKEYRLFLLEAGNGGAGPYYGLYALEKCGGVTDGTDPHFLSAPCLLRPGLPKGCDLSEALGCEQENWYQGAVHIGTQGCTYQMLLVLNGPYRGRVVYVDEEGQPPSPYFVGDPHFLAWYERWLDEMLWGYDTAWFGFGRPGKEPELAAVLTEARFSEEDRGEALETLLRIPALGSESLHAAGQALQASTPLVRARAARLIGKHRYCEGLSSLQALLADSESDVREAALSGLAQMPGIDWAAAARNALHDPVPSVVFTGLRLLKEAKQLRWEDIDLLYTSANARIRLRAVHAAGSLPQSSEDGPLREDLIHDSDSHVRRFAVAEIGKRRDYRKVPDLLQLLVSERDADVMNFIIRALVEIGDKQTVPQLIALTEHSNSFVREEAARALGEFRDPRAIPALKRLLADDCKPEKRENNLPVVMSSKSVGDVAREALRQIGSPGTLWLKRLLSRGRW